MPALRNVLTAAAAALLAALPLQGASAQSRTEVGVLECFVEGGVGLIIGSSKDMTCTFSPSAGPEESYGGRIDKLGLDVGITGRSVIEWLVFAPTSGYQPRSLVGQYAGVSGEVSLGVGIGANALIGGSNDTIVLQPISVQAQTGLNIAVGVSSLRLY